MIIIIFTITIVNIITIMRKTVQKSIRHEILTSHLHLLRTGEEEHKGPIMNNINKEQGFLKKHEIINLTSSPCMQDQRRGEQPWLSALLTSAPCSSSACRDICRIKNIIKKRLEKKGAALAVSFGHVPCFRSPAETSVG